MLTALQLHQTIGALQVVPIEQDNVKYPKTKLLEAEKWINLTQISILDKLARIQSVTGKGMKVKV
jgi:hypothetical protein